MPWLRCWGREQTIVSKQYAVKETFRTIQGEGYHAGTPAFFIRLAGCNMWSGHEEDRARDAERNEAHCPRWCDTDFVGGFMMTAQEVAAKVPTDVPLVVISGGEPLLQVDDALLGMIRVRTNALIAIETNGTVEAKFMPSPWVWITLSPKRSRAKTKLTTASELKLVWPDYDPYEWADFAAVHKFIQPRANRDIRDEVNEREAALLVAEQGRWRLSLQTHKVTRMR